MVVHIIYTNKHLQEILITKFDKNNAFNSKIGSPWTPDNMKPAVSCIRHELKQGKGGHYLVYYLFSCSCLFWLMHLLNILFISINALVLLSSKGSFVSSKHMVNILITLICRVNTLICFWFCRTFFRGHLFHISVVSMGYLYE